jgi:hypothetical protein
MKRRDLLKKIFTLATGGLVVKSVSLPQSALDAADVSVSPVAEYLKADLVAYWTSSKCGDGNWHHVCYQFENGEITRTYLDGHEVTVDGIRCQFEDGKLIRTFPDERKVLVPLEGIYYQFDDGKVTHTYFDGQEVFVTGE